VDAGVVDVRARALATAAGADVDNLPPSSLATVGCSLTGPAALFCNAAFTGLSSSDW
jgi:hypothetical protein